MKIHLLTDYYKNPRPERAEELDMCFLENVYSKEFDHIHIFAQSPLPIEEVPTNVSIIPIGDRLTYQYYINYATNNIPEGDIVVLSNADIFFDESITKVKDINLSDKVLALTRFCPYHGHWIDEHGRVTLYHNHNRSQDVWIWKNTLQMLKGDYNFKLGTLGCDNKIAYQFTLDGYQVWNPSLSIIVYHKHRERNDEVDHRLTGPMVWHPRPYLLPNACSLEDVVTSDYKQYITIE
jgi:hypothetical protein